MSNNKQKNNNKLLWTIVKAAGGALAPIFVFILIIVGLISAVGEILKSAFSLFDGFSSLSGMDGTSSYGARVFYTEDKKSANELADSYLNFTYEILTDLKTSNPTYTFSIDLSKEPSENQTIVQITTNYTSKIYELTIPQNPETPEPAEESPKTLLDYALAIDHFGFSEQEKELAINSIATDIQATSTSGKTVDEFKQVLNTLYTSNAGKYFMNVKVSKYYIKDYLVKDGETISGITKQNYFGFVYMPKKSVKFTYTAFVFATEKDLTVELKSNKSGTITTEQEQQTVDSTWFDEDIPDKEYVCNKNINISEFTAINTGNLNYLTSGKSLYQIYKDGKLNDYFKIDLNNLPNIPLLNIQGLYMPKEFLLQLINSNEYLYLQMDAQEPFLFVEYETDVK